jgi:hypothetical protein
MGITCRYRVDATQPSDTPTTREKLPQAIFKKLIENFLKYFDMKLNIICIPPDYSN